MTSEALQDALAQIRGWLEHEVRTEDPELCLFCIGEIVQEMIDDTPGIPPYPEEDEDDAP